MLFLMAFEDAHELTGRCYDRLIGRGDAVTRLELEASPGHAGALNMSERAMLVVVMAQATREQLVCVSNARRSWEHLPLVVIVDRDDDQTRDALCDVGVDGVVSVDGETLDGLEQGLALVGDDDSSRREIELILDGVSDPVIVVDADGRVQFSNPVATACLGRGEAAVEAAGVDLKALVADRRGLLVVALDGGRRVWDVKVRRLRISGSRCRVLVFHDVTEEPTSARVLEELRASQQAMLRALPIVMWIVDAELQVLFFRGELAVEGEVVTQRPGVTLCEFLGEACREEVLEAHRAALRGETGTATLSWLSRSWDVHVAKIEHDAVHRGEVLGGEAVAVCVDVTRRERLQKALFDAQKLEAVGHLAGGVAHEINTPMQYVGDNLQFLEMALEQFEKAFDLLMSEVDTESGVHARLGKMKLAYLRQEAPSAVSQSLEGVARVSKIVRALKQSTLMEVGPPEPTSLNTVVKNAVNVSQNEWKYTAEVKCELGEDLPPLLGVPGDLTRAVLALLVNASQAIKETNAVSDRGLITLRTYAIEDAIVLEVQDDGGGIPGEIRDKIFHQFFTTKETGDGLGQGLTIARSIFVDRHGASIDFEVDEGVGTTFAVRFPRSV